MGKTCKIIVCGKKATGKTTVLEHLIYNNAVMNSSSSIVQSSLSRPGGGNGGSTGPADRYFSTIEDIYVACWEKDKGVKEKLRFYDTKGMENAKDADTINQIRHLFSTSDGAVLMFSSTDPDSITCVEKLKQEIEKSKDKKEICHFILIDNNMPQMVASYQANEVNKGEVRADLQNRLRCNVYEFTGLDKRDALCKPFIDLATNITQIPTKGSMNLVQPFKKPKVFSSNK